MRFKKISTERLLLWFSLILAALLLVESIAYIIQIELLKNHYDPVEQHVIIPRECLIYNESVNALLNKLGAELEIVNPQDINEWTQNGKKLDVFVGAYHLPDVRKYCNCTSDYNPA